MRYTMPMGEKKPAPGKIPFACRGAGLTGQLLIASPQMPDTGFAQSVIYIYHHSAEGALGFVLNKPATDIQLADLLKPYRRAPRPFSRTEAEHKIAIVYGGPIDAKRGFVLHTKDFRCAGTQSESRQQVALTTSADILSAMAKNQGPRKAVIALGYAGWAPGQLERELRDNSWLSTESGESLVFDESAQLLYQAALKQIGVNLAALSPRAGLA